MGVLVGDSLSLGVCVWRGSGIFGGWGLFLVCVY